MNSLCFLDSLNELKRLCLEENVGRCGRLKRLLARELQREVQES